MFEFNHLTPRIVFKLKTLLPLSTWRGVAECLTFLNGDGGEVEESQT
jgi:hypothetical protein